MCSNSSNMNTKYKTTKIWTSSLENLRILAALKKTTMTAILDDLITIELRSEYEKVQGITVKRSST